MLLWSVMPEDVVWQGFGRTSPYREINREGRFYLMKMCIRDSSCVE